MGNEFFSKWWLPADLSVHGAPIDTMTVTIHWFMALLFVGWGIFWVYCLVRFNAKRHPKAIYEPVKGTASKFIEVGVIIFEAILLVGFSMPVWAQWKNEFPPLEKAAHVRVIAKQFEWIAHYPGPDGKWGARRPDLAVGGTAKEAIGLDESDPDAKDDVLAPINTVYVPFDRPVIMTLYSQDVIHSLGVPLLRLKQDAVPGAAIPIHFVVKKQEKLPQKIEIACSQLCGNSHYRMRGFIQPLPDDEYRAKVKEGKTPSYPTLQSAPAAAGQR